MQPASPLLDPVHVASFVPLDLWLDNKTEPPPQTARFSTVVLGLDVGQIRDNSALCVVAYYDVLLAPGDPLCFEQPTFETRYRVLGAEHLPLGTSYPEVARRVARIAKRLYDRDSRGDYHLLADATGVGRPVIDLLKDQLIPQCHVTAVTITGSSAGDDSILWRHEARVGKVWLVSRLQAILQGRRLQAPRTPEMEAMIAELKTFEIRVKAETGHEQSGAFAVGTHDDLCTALALACASEHQDVRYGPTTGTLPSPRM